MSTWSIVCLLCCCCECCNYNCLSNLAGEPTKKCWLVAKIWFAHFILCSITIYKYIYVIGHCTNSNCFLLYLVIPCLFSVDFDRSVILNHFNVSVLHASEIKISHILFLKRFAPIVVLLYFVFVFVCVSVKFENNTFIYW